MNINKENYEEYLFDYLEGNLSAEQAAELAKLIDADPFLQAELKAFKQTILTPSEDIIFPNKEALLKKNDRRKIIPLYYYLSAGVAAAIALLVVMYLPKENNVAPVQLANNPDTIINTLPDNNNDAIIEEDIIKDEMIGEETQLADNIPAGTLKIKENTIEDKKQTGDNVTHKKLEPINADMLEYNLRKNETEVANRIAFILPAKLENTASNNADSADNNNAFDDYTLNRFRLKQEIFDGVSSVFANIKKPKITLFTRDDDGKRKFRMIFQYDTYSAIIRVR